MFGRGGLCVLVSRNFRINGCRRRQLHTKTNTMKLLPKILIMLFIVAAAGTFFWLQSGNWCNKGDSLTMKTLTATVVGREQYTSDQLSGDLCHLTTTSGDVSADYYLDKTAIAKFRDASQKDTGHGCIVFSIKNTKVAHEMCF